MRSDQEIIIDMVAEWEGSLESLLPTVLIPVPILRPSFIPRRGSMAVPRPSPRVPCLMQPWGEVRKLFDTFPPPIDYDDTVVTCWTK